jgi:hypothetical protein
MNESDLILDPEVRERLEQVLGIEVPDPNSLEFQSLLEELQENQPDLFEEVMRGLTVNVEFPAEQQAGKVARRESFYALITRLIFRRSAVDGEPVAAKRRWLMYVFGVLALLGPGLYILGQTFSRNNEVAQEPQQLAQVDPIDPVQPEAPLTSAPPPAPEPEPEPALPPPAPMPVQAKDPEPAPTPPRPVTPPAPRPVTPPAPVAPTPAPPEPKEIPIVRPGSMTLYQNETPRPAQMTLFDNQATEDEAPASLTLFKDESTSDTLVVAQAEDTTPDTLLISEAEDTTPETLRIPISENPDATERPTELRIDQPEEEMPDTGLDTQQSGTADTAVAGAEGEGLADGIEVPLGKRLEDILQPGARIGALLETGIIVTQGTVTPVVAKSGSEWCTTPPCPEITWIGQASLDGSNRIQITFTQAVFDDAAQTISAMALGAGNTPGLTASIKDTAPTVAQDLLRSAAGGFADYIGALSQQKTVSYVDGIAVSQTETPPLDLFILGKMGSIFDLPENNTPIVRIAEAPAQAQLIVLFGISPTGATVPTTPQE